MRKIMLLSAGLFFIGYFLFEVPSNLILQRVNFHDNKLDLALVIADLQALDQLKQQLSEQAGMTVEIQSASALNERVEARLQLAKKGS